MNVVTFGDAWFRQVGRWKDCRPRCRYALSLNNRRTISCQNAVKVEEFDKIPVFGQLEKLNFLTPALAA